MEQTSGSDTRLLVQPGAGTASLVEGIEQARSTIHIVVFRFDRTDIETALKRAARRGVFVHALISHTSAGQGGAMTLRNLEMRLLADGITVTRTASDLIRYHGKLMVIDGEVLYLLGFNYTSLDIDRSRSFGIVTRRKVWVDEAEKLFQADALRRPYAAECESFIVSPGNARRRLLGLLNSAQREILIYDGKLSDPEMMGLLAAKVRTGVDVRILGMAGKRAAGVKLGRPTIRLHAQAVIRDGEEMFMGSQSLRSLELDARREVGIIVDDADIIRQAKETFEADWAKARSRETPAAVLQPDSDLALNTLDAPAEAAPALPPAATAELVKVAVKEAIKDAVLERLEPLANRAPIREAVKQAAREALHELGQ